MKTFKILMLVMLAASFTTVSASKKVDPEGTIPIVGVKKK